MTNKEAKKILNLVKDLLARNISMIAFINSLQEMVEQTL